MKTEPEVRISEASHCIALDLIELGSRVVAGSEELFLGAMARELAKDGFDPTIAVVAKEWRDTEQLHRIYLMAGVKRDVVANRGWFWFGDRKLTYHVLWEVAQVKERCVCDKELEIAIKKVSESD